MEPFDVIIIGSGIGGSALALILHSQGLKVCLVDKARHPRFALGEAGVKETSLAFALLGHHYRVPELIHLSSAGRVRRHIGRSSGQKQSFTFLWHKRGDAHTPAHIAQVGTLAFPFGTDTHYHRAEVDAYLARAAQRRGILLIEGADITSVAHLSPGLSLTLRGGRQLKARLLVDGPGIAPPHPEGAPPPPAHPPLQTHSYALFTHMRGLKPIENALPHLRSSSLPQRPSRGTTHHLFKGGWIWTIPFDNLPGGSNPLTSIGICLDPRIHPPDGSSPKDAFHRILRAHPSIDAHLRGGVPTFPIRRSPRLQRITDPTPAPWVVRPPHGVGFIDPLFSRGLYLTARGILKLSEGIVDCLGRGTPFEDALKPYGDWMTQALRHTDTLIHQAYQSFQSFEAFNAWHRVWGLGVYFESVRLAKHLLETLSTGALSHPQGPGLPLDIPEYQALFDLAGAALSRSPTPGADILQALNTSPILPPPTGYNDPEQRFLKARTLPQQRAIRRWALGPEGPPSLRHLFDYPLSAVPQALAWRWG